MPNLDDANRSEATFRQYWSDRFTLFTQDQNVSGMGAQPDGTPAIAGKKRRANNDDGYQYEGYRTYHDKSYNIFEKDPSDPTNSKTRKAYAHISEHGAIPSDGGSSLLEREMWQEHDKYSKEAQKKNNAAAHPDSKTGVEYKSIFKITTEKIFKKTPAPSPSPTPGASSGRTGGAKPNPDEEKKVERWELRPETRQKAEKVGEESFKTVEAAARDRGSENDENVLPNSVLMYEAARREYDAWWNSTLANLTQARANRAVKGGPDGIRARLDEDVATCERWAEETRAAFAKKASLKPDEQKELDRMKTQCKQMASVSYRTVNPDFQKDSNKPDAKEQLKAGGLEKEDARERDFRLQLEVLNNPQVNPNELDTNWEYQPKDLKSKVTVGFDESAKNPEISEVTPTEQVQSYNDQLASAAEGYEKVKKRFPQLDVNAKQVLQYQIKGQPSAKEISALPQELYEADSGVKVPKTKPQPQDYSQLLERKGR